MDKHRHIVKVLSAIRQEVPTSFQVDENALETAVSEDRYSASGVAVWLLSIVGGLLGAITFLSFITMSGLNKSNFGMTLTGLLLIALSLLIKRIYNKPLTDTIGITFFGLGFILFGIGLGRYGIDQNLIPAALMATGFLALLLVQHFVFSLVSLLIIHVGALNLLHSNKFYDGMYIYMILLALALWYTCKAEAQILRAWPICRRIYLPLRLAVLMAFLSVLIWSGIKDNIPVTGSLLSPAALFLGLMVLMIFSKVINVLNISRMNVKITVYTISLIVVFCCFKAPAIIGSMLAVLLCFFINFRSGTVLSLISLAAVVARYFYDINLSLPQKSGLLLLVGLVFILFYIFTNKFWKADEKV